MQNNFSSLSIARKKIAKQLALINELRHRVDSSCGEYNKIIVEFIPSNPLRASIRPVLHYLAG